MWDTGAEITTVPSCVAETLRLDTLPGGLMQTPTGDTPANVGAVLVFPGNVKRFVPVVTAVLGGANRKFDCIIGMDVIRQGDMMLLHDGEELVSVARQKYDAIVATEQPKAPVEDEEIVIEL